MAISGRAIQLALRSEVSPRLLPRPRDQPKLPPRPRSFIARGIKNRLFRLVSSATGGSDILGSRSDSSSSLRLIEEFYSSINAKDMKKLETLISEDCFFDDFSFPKPFQGKKETLHFLEQLILCMGQNTEFCIEHICEGVDQTAVVNWHLEWKKKQVPFTRGCSCYELSRGGEQLVIKKAQVIIESPIKPGGLALTLFKAITSIFDAFPGATERFLKSPYVIFQLLLNIYKMVLGPILSPIVTWYIKLLSLTAAFLSLAFKIVQFIIKFFDK